MKRRHWLASAAAITLCPAAAQAPPDARSDAPGARRADFRAALRSHGLVLMLRHASTEPGIGDPHGYRLDDCGSQRQLSTEGRAEALRLGRMLAAQGLQPSRVLSSRWCRCLDTARLAFGQVEPWPALDSFFDTCEREAAQTTTLRQALGLLVPGQLVAWVTHSVNISALTGQGAAMGEALVLRAERQPDGGLRVLRLGRIDAAGRA